MIKVRSGVTKIEQRKLNNLNLKRSYGLSIAKERFGEFSRVRSLAIAVVVSQKSLGVTDVAFLSMAHALWRHADSRSKRDSYTYLPVQESGLSGVL